MADDMRPDLGCYYQGSNQPTPTHPTMHTPNLDKLAMSSLLFKRAYVQYPLCAPSRQSLLTSRRPDTVKCYGFDTHWRDVAGNFTSLPQYFKEHGYTTIGMGKIFHEKSQPDPISWSEPFYMAPTDQGFYRQRRTDVWQSISETMQEEYPLPDTVISEHAIQSLRGLSNQFRDEGKNFFLAVGFIKPHLPLQYPAGYEDYYTLSEIPLPFPNYAAQSMPRVAWHSTVFHRYSPDHYKQIRNSFNETYPIDDIKHFRAGYYRSLSFSDAMIGRVLDELRALDLEESTVVSFLGDHGWHLGEQGMWRKLTTFEVSLRIPMMIRAPGLTDDGLETGELVEAVDLFPTLVDLAGLPSISTCVTSDEIICSEGRSMLPLFYDQTNATKQYAFSQVMRSSRMGYTVRNDRYRYTMWLNQHHKAKHTKKIVAEELYDYKEDKYETKNVASVPGYNLIARHLKSLLVEHLGVTSNSDWLMQTVL